MSESTIILFDDFNPDAPDYGQHGLERAENLVWSNGLFIPVRARLDINTDTAINAVKGGRGFSQLNGNYPFYFGSAVDLYYFGTGGGAATNLGGALANAQHWSFTRFGNSVIAADVANPMQVSTNLGAAANLITSVLTPRARYVTTIKNHVFAGNTDDGAAGAFNASQFWWSARNSAVNWQPGSDRAGFASLRSDVGAITGVVGFEDFGVIFCEHGVYRIDYIGGDLVWSPRQIGAEGDGMAQAAEDSPAVYGVDIYYWSRSGPAVVRAGESCQPLGFSSVRRRLAESPFGSSLSMGSLPIVGSACSERPIVAWSFTDVTTGDQQTWIYNVAEERWGGPVVVSEPNTIIAMAPRYQPLSSGERYAFDDIEFLVETGTPSVNRFRYSDPSFGLSPTIGLRKWTPAAGYRNRLVALRPVYRAFLTGGGVSTPIWTITVTPSNDPHFVTTDSPVPVTDAPANLDPNGYAVNGLPIEAQFFDFAISIAADPGTYDTLLGLEVVYDKAATVY